jgi:hypothetical protein
MITAEEARKLSGKTSAEYALDFNDAIRDAAKTGARTVLKYHGELENEAYHTTVRWKAFVEYMRGLGYSVELHYEERQFVDMRVKISW